MYPRTCVIVLLIAALFLVGCEGKIGPQGPEGLQGETGLQGEQGPPGPEEIIVIDGILSEGILHDNLFWLIDIPFEGETPDFTVLAVQVVDSEDYSLYVFEPEWVYTWDAVIKSSFVAIRKKETKPYVVENGMVYIIVIAEGIS